MDTSKFETSDFYLGAYLLYMGHEMLFAEQGDRGVNVVFDLSKDEGLRLMGEFKSDATAVAAYTFTECHRRIHRLAREVLRRGEAVCVCS